MPDELKCILIFYFSDKQMEYIGFHVFNRIGCLEPPYF